MRLLVTGAAGQLGSEIVSAVNDAPAELGIIGTTRAELDIDDPSTIRSALEATRPDVVINCAAWTAVDDCESDPERAMRLNGTAVANLVEEAERVGARVVQISTDYVFDGTKPTPYVESDPPTPTSVYGQSKFAGEQAAADHTVIRVSWVCGAHGANMVKTALRLADSHPVLRFVDDQVGSPTFAADAAPKIIELAAARTPGIFHLTNQGETSWWGFVREVFRRAGFDPDRVEPIKTSDLDPPRPAPRPANSRLENRNLLTAGFGPLLRPWEDGLDDLVRQLLAR